MPENTSVVILAAGRSLRMGSPKPFLLWKSNITFLEKIITEYIKFGCYRIILVVNEDTYKIIQNKDFLLMKEVTIVQNNEPDFGRFFSLKIGLIQIPYSDFVFVQDIDNPFVSFQLLKTIFKYRNNESYAVPTYLGKGGHPVMINRQIINHIINSDSNVLNLKDVLNTFTRLNVTVDDKTVLYNINTPEDYQRIIQNNEMDTAS